MAPRRTLYPRWGYLDKYSINPYLMRAVLITLGVHLAAFSGYTTWGRGQPGVVPVSRQGPIYPEPMIVAAHVATTPSAGPRLKIRNQSIAPLPVPDPTDFDSPVEPTHSGPPGGGGVEPPGDPPDGLFIAGCPTAEPDSTDFIPVEKLPVLVSMRQPEYNDLAREAGVSGDVVVRALIDEHGTVVRAFIVESVPLLDESALTAVRSALFKPAIQAGQPVSVWFTIPIAFQLYD